MIEDKAERKRQREREYYQNNKEQFRQRNKAYRIKHRESRLKSEAEYREANRETINEKQREAYCIDKKRFKQYAQSDYERHKERRKQYVTEWQSKNRYHVMIRGAKSRAHKSNIPFDITVDYIKSLVDNVDAPTCPVFNVPMQFSSGKGAPSSISPTIDKIVPSLGYVKGNVQVISHRANVIKSNGTLQEIVAVKEYVANISSNQELYEHDVTLICPKIRHQLTERIKQIKLRARKKNIECNIDRSYLMSILANVERPICPAFGIQMEWISITGQAMDTTPSIDKIIPSLGYTKGNISLICNKANRIKYDASLEELNQVIQYMLKMIKNRV